jgi:hypothetical protein
MQVLVGSRSWLRVLAVAGLSLGFGLPARAGIIVSVQNVSANAGTTGNTIEVDVTNTGPSSVDVASFSFEVGIASSSGVSFTGADITTSTAAYIFAGNSLFGPNIAFNTGTTLDAADAAVMGSSTLGSGSTLALGRLFFDVTSSAPIGAVPVMFTPFPSTSLTTPTLDNIPIDTLTSGTITVMPSTVVPEPSALVSATVGLFLSASFIWARYRSARKADTP